MVRRAANNLVDGQPQTLPLSSLMVPLLFFGYLLSYGDRVVFGLVLKPIEATLHLSDAEAGLLSGFAFAVTYALASPLAGYLVDRTSRKAIFLFAVFFWSAATFSCGLATTKLAMGIGRGAVGVGEALMVPLAVSIIGDTVAAARRARSVAFFFTGGPIGSLSVLLLGGLLLKHLGGRPLSVPVLGTIQPWQTLFLLLAGPGLVLFLVILLGMEDPTRSVDQLQEAKAGELGATVRFLRGHPALSSALFVGYPLIQVPGVAVAAWAFIYFDRVYGMPLEQAAVAFSFTAGITSIFGCLLSGRLVLLLRRRGYIDASLRACLIGGILFAAFAVLGLLAPSPRGALAFFSVAFFFSYVPTVGAYSTISEIAPPTIRARVTGLNALIAGIVATSLGPYMVGALSDHLFPDSKLGIRWAILTTLVFSVFGGFALLLPGLKALRSRIDAMRQSSEVDQTISSHLPSTL